MRPGHVIGQNFRRIRVDLARIVVRALRAALRQLVVCSVHNRLGANQRTIRSELRTRMGVGSTFPAYEALA